MTVDLAKVGGYLARHLSTILIVFGLLWMVGKPHAQQFVVDTVDERIKALENGQTELKADFGDVQQDVETLQQQVQIQRREQGADTEKILCAVGKTEFC